jgi:hypothetical protein
MRFGFFDPLPCADGYSERQRYQDIMADGTLPVRYEGETRLCNTVSFRYSSLS